MNKNYKLLLLEDRDTASNYLTFRIDRTKAINTIASLKAKVRLDSGGRLMVIEIPDKAEEDLLKRLPNARILSIGGEMSIDTKKFTQDEMLFLNALKKRSSNQYRISKANRKPGDSPEEQQLLSGPCIRNEY